MWDLNAGPADLARWLLSLISAVWFFNNLLYVVEMKVCPSRKKNTESGKVLNRCILLLSPPPPGHWYCLHWVMWDTLIFKLSPSLNTGEIWLQCLTTVAIHGFRQQWNLKFKGRMNQRKTWQISFSFSFSEENIFLQLYPDISLIQGHLDPKPCGQHCRGSHNIFRFKWPQSEGDWEHMDSQKWSCYADGKMIITITHPPIACAHHCSVGHPNGGLQWQVRPFTFHYLLQFIFQLWAARK